MKYYIVEALYPYAENNQAKKRPVLILTEPRSKYKSVIGAYITSRIFGDLGDTDILAYPDEDNGLAVNSLIRLHKVTLLEPQNLGEVIGELNQGMAIEIQAKLKALFNL
jgi:mRNA-degrading endonuclease toxin of MazEF toxin-antitoxin module